MITSNVNEDTRKKANLRVLQRLDSTIQDIICSATHVVLYEFSQSNQAWEKKNIEGSLFIVSSSSSSSSSYKVIVLNRNSINNLEVRISDAFQMQVKEPYLIFRDSTKSDIRGLWFHDDTERTFVSKCLNGVVQRLKNSNGNDDTTTNEQEDVVSAMSSLCIGTTTDNHNDSKAKAVINDPQEVILDKKNLQLTLMSLIQDERFLDLIHAQYVKVSNARSKKGNEKQPK